MDTKLADIVAAYDADLRLHDEKKHALLYLMKVRDEL